MRFITTLFAGLLGGICHTASADNFNTIVVKTTDGIESTIVLTESLTTTFSDTEAIFSDGNTSSCGNNCRVLSLPMPMASVPLRNSKPLHGRSSTVPHAALFWKTSPPIARFQSTTRRESASIMQLPQDITRFHWQTAPKASTLSPSVVPPIPSHCHEKVPCSHSQPHPDVMPHRGSTGQRPH